MFDYPLLEVLSAIERERDFERTALTLGFSKSYVSQRLTLLEERLGGIVVCRDTVTPTHLGSMLCRHLENIRLMEQDFLSENQHHFDANLIDPVTIKVGVGNDSLASWFKTVISNLSEEDNEYFLDIVTCDPATTLQDMKDGRIHCALSSSQEPMPGFESYHLGQHICQATATSDYVEKHFPKGINPSVISKAPTMLSSHDDPSLDAWIRLALGETSNVPANILPSAEGILNACLEGKVWAMNSCLLAKSHLDKGNLMELVPGLTLQSELYWHINKFTARTLLNLTTAVKEAALAELSDDSNQRLSDRDIQLDRLANEAAE